MQVLPRLEQGLQERHDIGFFVHLTFEGKLGGAIAVDEAVAAAAERDRAQRTLEDGHEVLETSLPALLTLTKDANKPRYPTAPGIFSAYRERTVERWGVAEVGADPEKVGLKGSPTQVKRSFSPPPKEPGEIIQAPPAEAARQLVSRLKQRNVLQ